MSYIARIDSNSSEDSTKRTGSDLIKKSTFVKVSVEIDKINNTEIQKIVQKAILDNQESNPIQELRIIGKTKDTVVVVAKKDHQDSGTKLNINLKDIKTQQGHSVTLMDSPTALVGKIKKDISSPKKEKSSLSEFAKLKADRLKEGKKLLHSLMSGIGGAECSVGSLLHFLSSALEGDNGLSQVLENSKEIADRLDHLRAQNQPISEKKIQEISKQTQSQLERLKPGEKFLLPGGIYQDNHYHPSLYEFTKAEDNKYHIKLISLDEQSSRYESGEYDPALKRERRSPFINFKDVPAEKLEFMLPTVIALQFPEKPSRLLEFIEKISISLISKMQKDSKVKEGEAEKDSESLQDAAKQATKLIKEQRINPVELLHHLLEVEPTSESGKSSEIKKTPMQQPTVARTLFTYWQFASPETYHKQRFQVELSTLKCLFEQNKDLLSDPEFCQDLLSCAKKISDEANKHPIKLFGNDSDLQEEGLKTVLETLKPIFETAQSALREISTQPLKLKASEPWGQKLNIPSSFSLGKLKKSKKAIAFEGQTLPLCQLPDQCKDPEILLRTAKEQLQICKDLFKANNFDHLEKVATDMLLHLPIPSDDTAVWNDTAKADEWLEMIEQYQEFLALSALNLRRGYQAPDRVLAAAIACAIFDKLCETKNLPFTDKFFVRLDLAPESQFAQPLSSVLEKQWEKINQYYDKKKAEGKRPLNFTVTPLAYTHELDHKQTPPPLIEDIPFYKEFAEKSLSPEEKKLYLNKFNQLDLLKLKSFNEEIFCDFGKNARMPKALQLQRRMYLMGVIIKDHGETLEKSVPWYDPFSKAEKDEKRLPTKDKIEFSIFTGNRPPFVEGDFPLKDHNFVFSQNEIQLNSASSVININQGDPVNAPYIRAGKQITAKEKKIANISIKKRVDSLNGNDQHRRAIKEDPSTRPMILAQMKNPGKRIEQTALALLDNPNYLQSAKRWAELGLFPSKDLKTWMNANHNKAKEVLEKLLKEFKTQAVIAKDPISAAFLLNLINLYVNYLNDSSLDKGEIQGILKKNIASQDPISLFKIVLAIAPDGTATQQYVAEEALMAYSRNFDSGSLKMDKLSDVQQTEILTAFFIYHSGTLPAYQKNPVAEGQIDCLWNKLRSSFLDKLSDNKEFRNRLLNGVFSALGNHPQRETEWIQEEDKLFFSWGSFQMDLDAHRLYFEGKSSTAIPHSICQNPHYKNFFGNEQLHAHIHYYKDDKGKSIPCYEPAVSSVAEPSFRIFDMGQGNVTFSQKLQLTTSKTAWCQYVEAKPALSKSTEEIDPNTVEYPKELAGLFQGNNCWRDPEHPNYLWITNAKGECLYQITLHQDSRNGWQFKKITRVSDQATLLNVTNTTDNALIRVLSNIESPEHVLCWELNGKFHDVQYPHLQINGKPLRYIVRAGKQGVEYECENMRGFFLDVRSKSIENRSHPVERLGADPLPQGFSMFHLLRSKRGQQKILIPGREIERGKRVEAHSESISSPLTQKEAAIGKDRWYSETHIKDKDFSTPEEQQLFSFDVALFTKQLSSKQPREGNLMLSYVMLTQRRYEEAIEYLKRSAINLNTASAETLSAYNLTGEWIKNWKDRTPQGNLFRLHFALQIAPTNSEWILPLYDQYYADERAGRIPLELKLNQANREKCEALLSENDREIIQKSIEQEKAKEIHAEAPSKMPATSIKTAFEGFPLFYIAIKVPKWLSKKLAGPLSADFRELYKEIKEKDIASEDFKKIEKRVNNFYSQNQIEKNAQRYLKMAIELKKLGKEKDLPTIDIESFKETIQKARQEAKPGEKPQTFKEKFVKIFFPEKIKKDFELFTKLESSALGVIAQEATQIKKPSFPEPKAPRLTGITLEERKKNELGSLETYLVNNPAPSLPETLKVSETHQGLPILLTSQNQDKINSCFNLVTHGVDQNLVKKINDTFERKEIQNAKEPALKKEAEQLKKAAIAYITPGKRDIQLNEDSKNLDILSKEIAHGAEGKLAHTKKEAVLKILFPQKTAKENLELINSPKMHKITQRLTGLFLRGEMKKVNEIYGLNLSNEQIEELKTNFHEYLVATVAANEWEKANQLYQKILFSKKDDPQSIKKRNLLVQELYDLLNEKRYFNPKTIEGRKNLFVEYTKGIALREGQTTISDALQNFANVICQLGMGEGKSTFVAPKKLSQGAGTTLPVAIVLESLFDISANILGNSCYELFDMKVLPFKFDRQTPVAADDLKDIYCLFAKAIKDENAIVTTRSSLLSLRNKSIELIRLYHETKQASQKDPNAAKNLEELQEQLEWMGKIIDLLKTRGDFFGDEVHKLLDIRKEINYALGIPENSLDQQKIDSGLWLMEKFMMDKGLQKEATLIFKNEQAVLSRDEEAIKKIKTGLGTLFLEEKCKELTELESEGFSKEIFISYLRGDVIDSTFIDPATHLPRFMLKLKEKNPNLFNDIACSREFIRRAIPAGLSKKEGVNMGRAEDGVETIVFEGNEPSPSKFSDDFEVIVNHCLDYIHKGVSLEQVKAMVEASKQRAINEDKEHHTEGLFPLRNTPEGQKFFATYEYHLDEINQTNLEAIRAKISLDSKEDKAETSLQRLAFLKTWVLPRLKPQRLQISSKPYHLVEMGRQFSAVSGTTSNYLTFHPKLLENQEFAASSKTGGKTVAMLLEMNPSIHVKTVNPQKPFDALKSTLMTENAVISIVDLGNVLKDSDSSTIGDQVTEVLSQKATAQGQTFKKVLTYKNSAGDLVDRSSDEEETMLISESPASPDDRFSIIKDCTGTDIQHGTGTAIVTIGELTTTDDLFQAVWRMRKLGTLQNVSFFIPETIANIINPRGAPTIEDLMIFCLKNDAKAKPENNLRAEKRSIECTMPELAYLQLNRLLVNSNVPNKWEILDKLYARYEPYLVRKTVDNIDNLAKCQEECDTDDVLIQRAKNECENWRKIAKDMKSDPELSPYADELLELLNTELSWREEKETFEKKRIIGKDDLPSRTLISDFENEGMESQAEAQVEAKADVRAEEMSELMQEVFAEQVSEQQAERESALQPGEDIVYNSRQEEFGTMQEAWDKEPPELFKKSFEEINDLFDINLSCTDNLFPCELSDEAQKDLAAKEPKVAFFTPYRNELLQVLIMQDPETKQFKIQAGDLYDYAEDWKLSNIEFAETFLQKLDERDQIELKENKDLAGRSKYAYNPGAERDEFLQQQAKARVRIDEIEKTPRRKKFTNALQENNKEYFAAVVDLRSEGGFILRANKKTPLNDLSENTKYNLMNLFSEDAKLPEEVMQEDSSSIPWPEGSADRKTYIRLVGTMQLLRGEYEFTHPETRKVMEEWLRGQPKEKIVEIKKLMEKTVVHTLPQGKTFGYNLSWLASILNELSQ